MSEERGDATDALGLLGQPLASPWARLWARLFDISVLMFVLAAVLHGIGPSIFGDQFLMDPAYDPLVTLALLPIAFLLDALIQALFGNSLGKLIAGIRVETTNLERPRLRQHAKRNLLVWLKGIGLGIPIVSLFAMMACYMTVRSGRLTSWDASNSVRVFSRGSNIYRTLLAFGAFFALSAGAVVLSVIDATGIATQHSAAEIATANEGLPLQIDEHLRLDSIKDNAGVVTYTYTLVNSQGAPSMTPTQMSGLNSERFRNVFTKGYCGLNRSGPHSLPTYAAHYRYLTIQGVVVTEFTLTPQSCAGVGAEAGN